MKVVNKNDLISTGEENVLKVIKKDNNDLADLDLIFDSFDKHFFIKALDKEYR